MLKSPGTMVQSLFQSSCIGVELLQFDSEWKPLPFRVPHSYSPKSPIKFSFLPLRRSMPKTGMHHPCRSTPSPSDAAPAGRKHFEARIPGPQSIRFEAQQKNPARKSLISGGPDALTSVARKTWEQVEVTHDASWFWAVGQTGS